MTDPARWLSAEVPEWTELNRREKCAIRDFPVLWALFELHATGQGAQRPNANPDNICLAVERLAEPPALGPELSSAREHFASRYFCEGRPTHAWRQLRIRDDIEARVTQGLTDRHANTREVFAALLLVVNRLRNNYLHGEKARYGFRDQYENFRHANNVLVAAIGTWPRPT